MYGANGISGAMDVQSAQKMAVMDRTIGQNIDSRITELKAEIERLEGVKAQLQSGASLLDVKIDDLRRAMNYRPTAAHSGSRLRERLAATVQAVRRAEGASETSAELGAGE
jgi:hypothetical protein